MTDTPSTDAPKRIWLQWKWGRSDGTAFDGEGVPWCRDKIDDTDVEYVLAARLRELEAENASLKRASRFWSEADHGNLCTALEARDRARQQRDDARAEVERLRAELENQDIDPPDDPLDRDNL